ncbi:MAG: hypothetical protein JWO06_2831 [Bacteroidota bacterium]|nr:hypothetical protein [Bacteroidota bacterium]
MRIRLALLFFTAGFCASAQKDFSYMDKAGHKISVDLSLLPSFLDSTFLRSNLSFDSDTSQKRPYCYSIDEFGCQKKAARMIGFHEKKFNVNRHHQIVFMRVHGAPCYTKKDSTLEEILGSSGFADYEFILTRTGKMKYKIDRLVFLGAEI